MSSLSSAFTSRGHLPHFPSSDRRRIDLLYASSTPYRADHFVSLLPFSSHPSRVTTPLTGWPAGRPNGGRPTTNTHHPSHSSWGPREFVGCLGFGCAGRCGLRRSVGEFVEGDVVDLSRQSVSYRGREASHQFPFFYSVHFRPARIRPPLEKSLTSQVSLTTATHP
ncbi:hypothetical protein DENSPDRAFT_675351 [Dentipellis sp. KUC8613]|nr:hypothetical protein DENSPDRAFT_675351 [Dentipellis sp. KUC8613]